MGTRIRMRSIFGALGSMLLMSGLTAGTREPQNTAEVTESIESTLKSGSPRENIEKFFTDAGLGFSYDRFNGRFQSIIRGVGNDPDVDHAIVIYIYVDNFGRYVRNEVTDSYTAPK